MASALKSLFIKAVLPFASWWVEKQERRILAEGSALTTSEKKWAADLGVQDVDKIRLLTVPVVPLPGAPVIYVLADLFRYPLAPIGMAARYGIYLNYHSRNDPSLLVHELAHVAQYERLGGIRPFLDRYLHECLRDGYWDAAMELEARGAAIPFNRPPDR